jgi:T-complex protein 1 subunit eta
MVVKGVCKLDCHLLDLRMLGIKKLVGGNLSDSMFVDGVAIEKTFSYAGFEQLPKILKKPLVLCLNVELELKAERENAEIRVADVMKYQTVVETEWNIIYNKLDACAQSGAKVVMSRYSIGDLSTQYFADRGIFCAGRIPDDDLARLTKATGGMILTSVNRISPSVLGTCKNFEDKSLGNKRYNIFSGCPNGHIVTLILRGGSEHFVNEVYRSLNDAVMITRRILKHKLFVPGGGAIEMNLSRFLREEAVKMNGKEHLVTLAYAKALEIIPRQLCDNAGLDTPEILNKLRQKHYLSDTKAKNFGININTGNLCNMAEDFILEPALVKLNSLQASTEAVCLILAIDETIRNRGLSNSSNNPIDK